MKLILGEEKPHKEIEVSVVQHGSWGHVTIQYNGIDVFWLDEESGALGRFVLDNTQREGLESVGVVLNAVNNSVESLWD